MTKVISFVAQKGGSGKSTMTLLLANYYAYKEKKNVVVIDGDAPQYNIYKLRAGEKENPDTVADSVYKAHQEVGIPPYNIFCAVADPAQENKEKKIFSVTTLIDGLVAKGDIDYIFVDLAGTINTASFASIIKRVNYIFVPYMEAENLFNSNLEALYTIMLIANKYKDHNIKGIYEFWHKYRSNMSATLFESLAKRFPPFNEKIRTLNIKADMMTNKIGYSTKAFNKELWNTLAAPPNSYLSLLPNGLNLGNFIREFNFLIKD